MSRLLPYPLMTASLLLMWLLLNGMTIGHLALGIPIAILASRTMSALQPSKPRIRRWIAIPKLVGIVALDVLRSNIAVARFILTTPKATSRSGFVSIPLTIQDRTALAVLACIVTSTPGTAWIEYRSRKNVLLLHVLDVGDEQVWIDLVQDRYEPLLMEIFQ
ncbi:MAG: Na+/H+ antiporter subunit E [Rhizobiaceae bacterium]|nr:Na+/H+ antiporter subunit E [Rhizobiaceae bacterium]